MRRIAGEYDLGEARSKANQLPETAPRRAPPNAMKEPGRSLPFFRASSPSALRRACKEMAHLVFSLAGQLPMFGRAFASIDAENASAWAAQTLRLTRGLLRAPPSPFRWDGLTPCRRGSLLRRRDTAFLQPTEGIPPSRIPHMSDDRPIDIRRPKGFGAHPVAFRATTREHPPIPPIPGSLLAADEFHP